MWVFLFFPGAEQGGGETGSCLGQAGSGSNCYLILGDFSGRELIKIAYIHVRAGGIEKVIRSFKFSVSAVSAIRTQLKHLAFQFGLAQLCERVRKLHWYPKEEKATFTSPFLPFQRVRRSG